MRYGIIADIHGNLEALDAVIAQCRQEGVRAFFCLGDIVGYGANPEECIERIQQLKAICIAGNHDWAVLGKLDISRFNPTAKDSVIWTKDQLSSSSITYLNSLDLTFRNEHFVAVHGTLNTPEKFNYLNDTSGSLDTFFLMDRKVCFLAHTHVPKVFVQEEENIHYTEGKTIELAMDKKYIVNVGSVGQPRDGNPEASFCIYDPDLERVELRRVSYDVALTQQKIVTAGLPEILAQRLSIGQ